MKNMNGEKIEAVRSTKGSAAYDLVCNNEEDIILTKKSIIVGTGIKLELAEDMHALILPRSSSLYKKSINVEIGLIDSDYKDEIRVQISSNVKGTVLKKGDIVAQLLLQKTFYFEPSVVKNENMEHTGFGSTDVIEKSELCDSKVDDLKDLDESNKDNKFDGFSIFW